MGLSINKKQAYWILQLSGWSLYVVIYLILLFIADKVTFIKAINIILFASYYLVSTHILRNIVIKNGWLAISPVKLLPRILVAVFIIAISNYLFQIVVSYSLHTLSYTEDFKLINILGSVFASIVFYMLWSLIYFIYHYFEKYNASLKYDAAIYEIELNKLKSQLNPHFIFNALNSIRALVDEDPSKSKRAITQLSNILRNSLIMNKRKLIDFRDEINTVKDYLELESIRLEERLKINFEITPGADLYQIPPLMLQTLVENGIKHGVSTLTTGGMISLKAWTENHKLRIQIRNSGQYINGTQMDIPGYGLENTRQRLKLIYGEAASFSIGNEDNCTVVTEIIIPQYI